jgi:hypothetical protein
MVASKSLYDAGRASWRQEGRRVRISFGLLFDESEDRRKRHLAGNPGIYKRVSVRQ